MKHIHSAGKTIKKCHRKIVMKPFRLKGTVFFNVDLR